jgi:mannose-6-phosphate isomerase
LTLYPLLFEPCYVYKIWGGRKMESLLGRALPEGPVGESWELCDRTDAQSVVAHGPLQGKTLGQLLQEHGAELMGPRLHERHGKQFPLLFKLIDAAEDLSVQVHPDDAYARKHQGPAANGKTEMWVVLQADPGASLWAGLNPGVDQRRFNAALDQGRLQEVLQRLSVQAGDAVFVPAGMVHAIGKGCLVAEVQQNSDATYRVFDWDRLENGLPRALHVPQAMDVMRFGAEAPSLQRAQPLPGLPGRSVLVDCGHFHAEQQNIGDLSPFSASQDCQVLMVTKGRGRLKPAQGAELQLAVGATVLLPAQTSFALVKDTDLFQVLMVTIPV